MKSLPGPIGLSEDLMKLLDEGDPTNKLPLSKKLPIYPILLYVRATTGCINVELIGGPKIYQQSYLTCGWGRARLVQQSILSRTGILKVMHEF